MSKHTPGPWMVQNGKIVEKCYNGFVIADVRNATEVMADEANACLIAAAPELLEACKAYIRYCDDGEGEIAPMYKTMKAAIAKAEGEEK